jgi:hypothetical protein
MRLIELQSGFRRWLTSGSTEADARLADGQRAGLEVYQNNYRSQLVGCLEQSYPQLRTWLGDGVFLHAAKTHIDRQAPHAWTLDAYGEEFGATLRVLFPNNPDLQELAWIEWALATAFVARDAQPIDAAALAAIDWDSARLTFTPSLQVAPLTTNAADIWWAMNDQAGRPEGQMLAAPGGVIAWRRGHVSCLRTLDALELRALQQVRADGSFTNLCDTLVAELGENDGVAKAGALLGDWISSDMICGLDDEGVLRHE